ncbi:hypothetical protein ACO0LF_17560 [Undibacterium sp. Di27W]|uniref:hypothetical protein n=1 Tax=Undibacterium sp. Di27W TaxID=3413036 RepID=UPI003BF02F97
MKLSGYFLSLLMTYSLAAYGACNDQFIDEVRHGLGYHEELYYRDRLTACTPHPAMLGVNIVAIARRQKGTEIGDSDVMGTYSLDISLVNDKTGKTLKHQLFPKKLYWDGTEFDGMRIDTTNYNIATGVRAFGIRVGYSTARFAYEEPLSIFMVRGSKIVEVLSNADMLIHFDRRIRECRNEARDATRTIGISSGRTHGFYDLLVTEELIDTHEELMQDENSESNSCQTKVDKKEIKKYLLRFDGKKYVIPQEMTSFECRIC